MNLVTDLLAAALDNAFNPPEGVNLEGEALAKAAVDVALEVFEADVELDFHHHAAHMTQSLGDRLREGLAALVFVQLQLRRCVECEELSNGREYCAICERGEVML